MSERPWAITLYERYVQRYGEPIEQPLPNALGNHHEEDQHPESSQPGPPPS